MKPHTEFRSGGGARFSIDMVSLTGNAHGMRKITYTNLSGCVVETRCIASLLTGVRDAMHRVSTTLSGSRPLTG
jgi:hypothetical protein